MGRAVAALPEGAELYEHSSVSIDGLRTLSQQLKHGWELTGETYKCQLNAADRSGVFASLIREDDAYNGINWNGDIETLRDILEPHLAALGVGRDAVEMYPHTKRVNLTLPVLRKTDVADKAKNETPISGVSKENVPAHEAEQTTTAEAPAKAEIRTKNDNASVSEKQEAEAESSAESDDGGIQKDAKGVGSANTQGQESTARLRTDENQPAETTDDSRYEESDEVRAVRKVAKDWSVKLGTPIKVIARIEDIENPEALAQVMVARTSGWYDTKTGEVCIFAPHLSSTAEAETTVIHEFAQC